VHCPLVYQQWDEEKFVQGPSLTKFVCITKFVCAENLRSWRGCGDRVVQQVLGFSSSFVALASTSGGISVAHFACR
jgi:hypothetical protein